MKLNTSILYRTRRNLCMLFVWLCMPLSTALASFNTDYKQKKEIFWSHIQVNFNSGIMLFNQGPMFPISDIGSIDAVSIEKRTLDMRVEVLYDYNLSSSSDKKIKTYLSTGIIYPFPNPLVAKKINMLFTEQYINIPLHFGISGLYRHVNWDWVLGYELAVNLSSQYKQSGFFQGLPASMCGNKNIKQFLPDTPTFLNRFFAEWLFKFPKGIHLGLKYHFIPALSVPKKAPHRRYELDTMFVKLLRSLAHPMIDVTLGINFVEWFLPPQESF